MPTFNQGLRLYIFGDAEAGAFVMPEMAGAANVLGNDEATSITGNSFDNILDGGLGADTLVGGSGNDTYVVDNDFDIVTELAGGGTDLILASVNVTLGNAPAVENLTFATGAGERNGNGNDLNNIITGNESANILDGGVGNDTLFGGDGGDELRGGVGNDVLDGGLGIDQMAGGTGDDFYVVDGATETLVEVANEGTDTVLASLTHTLQNNFENLVLMGTGNFAGTGNTLNNSLIGNSGTNTLTGLEGNDTLDGGLGADRLEGGVGNDTYVIDNSGDVIVDTSGTDTVVSWLGATTLAADLENLRAAAGTASSTLTGNAAANTLTGNAGANVLDGGAGADQLVGDAGNDTYIVDNTLDVVTEDWLGGDADIVRTSVSYTLAATADVEFLRASVPTSTTGLALTGSGTANTIEGTAGRDRLTGLGGDDVLKGGLGNDALRGGNGKDTFVFDTRLSRTNIDRVYDLDVRNDSFQLENRYMTKLGKVGKLSTDAFKVGTIAGDAEDRILYDSRTGILSYDADGNGRGGEVTIAQLARGLKLTAGDFFVI